MNPEDPTRTAWRADYRAVEERRREATLSVSAAARLRWLEEALRFAARVGALRSQKRADSEPER